MFSSIRRSEEPRLYSTHRSEELSMFDPKVWGSEVAGLSPRYCRCCIDSAIYWHTLEHAAFDPKVWGTNVILDPKVWGATFIFEPQVRGINYVRSKGLRFRSHRFVAKLLLVQTIDHASHCQHNVRFNCISEEVNVYSVTGVGHVRQVVNSACEAHAHSNAACNVV